MPDLSSVAAFYSWIFDFDLSPMGVETVFGSEMADCPV